MLQKKGYILKYSLCFLFFALLTAFCIHKIFDYDIWWHLTAGKYIFQNLSVPRGDIFTYTVSTHEWIDLHWLFQVICYLVTRAAGFTGLNILTAAVILFCFAVIFRLLAEKEVPSLILYPVLLWAAFIMEDRFLIRPEILSYVYISLFLFALNKFDKMSFPKMVFILVLVQILWVNTQGLFILGIVIAFCFFLEKSFRRLLRRGAADEAGRAAVVLLAVVLASLINPYGIKGLLFPLKLFIRIGPERNLFNLNIKEFISPFAGGGYLLFKSYAVCYLCVVLLRFRKLPLHRVLFSSAMLFLAASANRNINLFVLSSLPVVVPGLNGLFDRGSLRFKKVFSFPGARSFYSLALAGLVFLYAYLIYMVVSDTYYIRNSKMKRFGTGVNEMFYPGAAVDFVLKNDIKGRIFNDVGTGSYSVYFFYPDRLVYIDGRLEVMEYEHFSRFIHVIAYPDTEKIGKFLDEENMDIILFLFEPGGEELIRAFSLLKGWRLAFLSHSGVVFLREKEEYGKFMENREALIKELEKGILKEAGSELKKDSFFYGDPTRHYYYSRLLEALGYNRLAGLFLLQAIRINPELFYLHKAAGDFFLAAGDLVHAELFYRNALNIKKGDINVLLGLARIEIRKGDYQLAIDDLKAALDRKKTGTLFFYLGMSYFKLGDFNHSFEAFRKFSEYSRSQYLKAYGYLNMSACRIRQGNKEEGKALLSRALAISPGLKGKDMVPEMDNLPASIR